MTFDNCTQAYDAGRKNIPRSDPSYAPKLDRDKDGMACDNPPADFKAAPETTTGTRTAQPAGAPDQLPKTGSGAEIGVAGSALLMLGAAVALLVRRRRIRFTA